MQSPQGCSRHTTRVRTMAAARAATKGIRQRKRRMHGNDTGAHSADRANVKNNFVVELARAEVARRSSRGTFAQHRRDGAPQNRAQGERSGDEVQRLTCSSGITNGEAVENRTKLTIRTWLRLRAEAGRAVIGAQALQHGEHGAVMASTAAAAGWKIGFRGREQRWGNNGPQQHQ